ncbi:Dual-specificity kinase, spindle pole body (SPB) duplication and spindle checkpoint function [Actinomortierella ambigua]|nr:Dual-specificity kinase, spindle pole body (SPB) duplication and spindle checkpoint function [Actinomortierella ambigua]
MGARKFRPRSSSILARAKAGKTPDWGRPQRIVPGEDTEDTEGSTRLTATVGPPQEPAFSQDISARAGPQQQTIADQYKGPETAYGQTRPRQDIQDPDILEPASKRKKHEVMECSAMEFAAFMPAVQPHGAGTEAVAIPRRAGTPQEDQVGGGIAAIARTLAKGAPKRSPAKDSLLADHHNPQNDTGRSGSGSQAAGPLGASERGVIMVNNRPFTKLHAIGQGGSSKVFKVIGPHNKVYALKRVTFDKSDTKVAEGYLNEFDLLRKLDKCPNIITAFDAEINRAKGRIFMVLECGDVDLALMMLRHKKKPLDLNFVRHTWLQMLEAVKVIHDMNIVHTDLKPANFVLVEGVLKLIDFGIAGAISPDTTNLHRAAQMGTANYMPPEAFNESSAAGVKKMVYGKTPFSEFEELLQKMLRIINPQYEIKYPQEVLFSPPEPKATLSKSSANGGAVSESKDAANNSLESEPSPTPSPPTTCTTTSSPSLLAIRVRIDESVINVMRRILVRDPKKRPTIPQLLEDPFLHPQDELQKTREKLQRAEAELAKLGIAGGR